MSDRNYNATMPSVTIKLSDELHAGLKAKAAREDLSMAWVIRWALRQALDGMVTDPITCPTCKNRFPHHAIGCPGVPGSHIKGAAAPRIEAKQVIWEQGEPRLVDGGGLPLQPATKPEPCTHPITRRIGKDCGACGKTEVWK